MRLDQLLLMSPHVDPLLEDLAPTIVIQQQLRRNSPFTKSFSYISGLFKSAPSYCREDPHQDHPRRGRNLHPLASMNMPLLGCVLDAGMLVLMVYHMPLVQRTIMSQGGLIINLLVLIMHRLLSQTT